MTSNSYTLDNYLTDAKVLQPASFAKYLGMRFTPRPDQVVGLNRMLANTRFGLFDDPGCVSADTEYLSPTGWKRIDQYDGGEVMQFDAAKWRVQMVQPLRYVKEPCQTMIHWENPHTDQLVSEDHRMAYECPVTSKLKTVTAGELLERAKASNQFSPIHYMRIPVFNEAENRPVRKSLTQGLKITVRDNPEGFKYCFTVPSGFLVLRRNGKAFVTGNCGKTIQLQAKAFQLIFEGNKVLMLMPPVLLGQFVESMCEDFTGPERYISWHVLNQTPKHRETLYQLWEQKGWPDLLLMSYEMYVALMRVPKGEKRRNWYAHAIRENYRVIDCDEGHKLCGHTTYLHGTLDWHCGDVGESMLAIATGTPMPTTPLNAYGLIHLLNPGAYRDYNQFDRLHAVYKKIRLREPRITKRGGKIHFINKLEGFKGQEDIRRALYANGRRVIKEQVLTLNEPQIIEVPVVLGDAHMRLYKQLEKERILEYKGEIIAGGISEQRLRQALLRIVTNPEAFMPEGKTIYNAIKEMTLELIASHNNAMPLEDGFPNKIIVFCNLRATAAWLRTVLAPWNPVVLNGDTPDKDKARKAFTEDDKCRVLIANPESAGFGLNFQHTSCTNIFVEPTSVPGEFKQAMERTYRGGQAYVVQTYILRASGTIAPRATSEMLNRTQEINKVNKDSVILSSYFMRAA